MNTPALIQMEIFYEIRKSRPIKQKMKPLRSAQLSLYENLIFNIMSSTHQKLRLL